MTDTQIHYGDEALKFLDDAKLQQFSEHSERVYYKPGDDFDALVRRQRERFQDILKPKQVAVLTENNEAVSIGGFHQIGLMKDGRPVVEMGRSVTLETHRERGYYRQVMPKVMEELKKKFPNAIVVRSTQQKTPAKNAKEMGFKTLKIEDYIAYREAIEGTWTEVKKNNAATYQYSYLDLQSAKTTTSSEDAPQSS